MASLIRALRSRAAALAAVSATVALTAGFAALAATAWTVALPLGARADLAGSPADSLVIGSGAAKPQSAAQTDAVVRAAVARDAPGVFSVEQTLSSELYTLPGRTTADGSSRQTYVVSEPAVRIHAQLTQGAWPGPAVVAGAHGSAVPVAVPSAAAELMGLHLGQSLTLAYSVNLPPTTFQIVGEFRYLNSARDQAGLAWDAAGLSGVSFAAASAGLYGPLVADGSSFTSGAVPVTASAWTLVPNGSPDVGAIQAAVQSISDDQRISPSQGFAITDLALNQELGQVASRVTVGRGELLAATCLLGLLAGLAMAAAAEGLVARGAAHTALMRSRGAPAWKPALGYLPDAVLLVPAAAVGVFAQGPLVGRLLLRVPPITPSGGALGFGLPGVDWVAGLCTAALAAVILLTRAARAALPSRVAAASGRQDAVSGLALAGVDVALVALAAVALWQATNTGLTAGQGSGVVLIVACAPALTAAAGAAACGRLITVAALMSERAAGRAGILPLRLAAWELARTPRRHLVPALLCVAAVAGCGFAAAQHSTWQRSAHDQAGFQVGADVAVNLAQPQTLGQAGILARAPGVRSATPVYTSTSAQGPTVVGLDAAAAAQTVTLRPDQADRGLAKLWAAIMPSTEPGLPLPGHPTGIGITARLSASKLTGTSVALTIEDATGTAYTLSAGTLPTDGRDHTLQATLAPDASGIAYPVRLIGISLDYQLPGVDAIDGSLAVNAVAVRQSAAAQFIPVQGAAAAMETWTSGTNWNPQDLLIGCGPPFGGPATPASIIGRTGGAAGIHTSFASGRGFGSPSPCTVTLDAGSTDTAVPGIATAAYLKASQQAVGSVVEVQIDQVAVQVRIAAVVEDFPGLGQGGSATPALVVDLGELSDQALLLNDPLPAASTWWLHTADGAIPPNLPTGAVAVSTAQTQTSLINDPMAAIPQRVSAVGAVGLTLLALLGLLVSLSSSARESTARDTVLCALGLTRRQRAALGCALHTAVAGPAALLGVALGILLARLLVPEFILSPAATTPVPSPITLYALSWSAAALAVITLCTAAAALAASARRRDPAAVSRSGA
ncbi:hypothetical protein KDL01_09290 [Actinospica durhamensis]|uniref:ABC3 transporter permease C-terminal domain-containing protein n=1 Tax=Actinospica durhamensis TaxID=1508375 RepID=A0A941IR07_9ACTN|nr:FtsX-like permease family protein [Actinospica durhamensis]MBR7833458.1 hypothetical protein [Actinospica durhamensis]